MKRLFQFVSLVLVLSMALAIPAQASQIDPRASEFFMSHSSYIQELSSTQFKVWFQVAALHIMDELGASKIYVQRSTDGVNWETVQTYSKANYVSMVCSNTGTHSGYVMYTGASPSYFYRARVDYYAKLGSSTATYIDYTAYI